MDRKTSILYEESKHPQGGFRLQMFLNGRQVKEIRFPNKDALENALDLALSTLVAVGFYQIEHGNPSQIYEFVKIS